MKNLTKNIQKFWLAEAVAVVVGAALLVPWVAAPLLEVGAVDIGVVLIMLAAGFKTPFRRFVGLLKHPVSIVISIGSIFLVSPVVALLLAPMFNLANPESQLSVLILASQATTLATGIVLTEASGGNVAFSVIVSIVSNMLSPLITPLVLRLSADAVVVDYRDMVLHMMFKIAVPVIVGQLLRRRFAHLAVAYAKPLSLSSQLIVLLILYTGLSLTIGRLIQDGVQIVKVLLFVVSLHFMLLLVNAVIASRICRTAEHRAAFVLISAEKTLPAAMLIWKTHFQSLPLGPIIAVSYHLIQLVVDAILAPGLLSLPLVRKEGASNDR